MLTLECSVDVSWVRLTTVLVGLSQNLCLVNALVDTVQPFRDALAEERIVLDFEQVVNDEPDGLVCSHPVLRIEAREAHRAREAAQRPFLSQVKVDVEIAESQLPKCAIDRFAVAASG